MKILFLDQYSEMGGAQRVLADFLPTVQRRGWGAHVAVPGGGPADATDVISLRLFKEAFTNFNMGIGATVAMRIAMLQP